MYKKAKNTMERKSNKERKIVKEHKKGKNTMERKNQR